MFSKLALDMISLWWLFALGFGLFLAGRFLLDYTIGVLGGVILFLTGLYVLINPITEIGSGFLNTGIGSALIGVGGYIFVVGSLELLEERGFSFSVFNSK